MKPKLATTIQFASDLIFQFDLLTLNSKELDQLDEKIELTNLIKDSSLVDCFEIMNCNKDDALMNDLIKILEKTNVDFIVENNIGKNLTRYDFSQTKNSPLMDLLVSKRTISQSNKTKAIKEFDRLLGFEEKKQKSKQEKKKVRTAESCNIVETTEFVDSDANREKMFEVMEECLIWLQNNDGNDDIGNDKLLSLHTEIVIQKRQKSLHVFTSELEKILILLDKIISQHSDGSHLACVITLKILEDAPSIVWVSECLDHIVSYIKSVFQEDQNPKKLSELLILLISVSSSGISGENIIQLIDICLNMIFPEPKSDLYHPAMSLLVDLYDKNPTQREYLLNALISQLVKIEDKIAMYWKLDDLKLCFFTPLIVEIVQSHRNADDAAVCAQYFAKQLLTRSSGSDKIVIPKWIDDLMAIWNHPCFPCVDLLIHSILTFSQENCLDEKWRGFCITTIGKIACTMKRTPKDETLDEISLIPLELSAKLNLKQRDARKLEVILYLSHRRSENSVFGNASRYLLCNLFPEDSPEFEQVFALTRDVFSTKFSSSKRESFEMMHRMNLVSNCSFDSCLETILSNMNDGKATFRSLSMKALSNLAEIDSTILENQFVMKTVQDRLSDESPKVRESILEILSVVLCQSSAHLQSYLQLILERIADDAPSVRKRSVIVLSEILEQGLVQDSIVVEICLALSQLLTLEESDSVKAQVYKLYSKLWAKPRGVLQIIDILSLKPINWKTARTHWFLSCLGKFKLDTNEVLDHMLTLEEETDSLIGRNSVTACLSFLHLVCLQDSRCLANSATLLSKYLDSQYTKMIDMIFHTCCIFRLIMPHLKALDSKFEKSFLDNCLQLIFKSNNLYFDALIECVALLCSFSAKTGNFSYLKIFENCVSAVKTFLAKQTKAPQEYETTARLLTTIALFCRFCDFEKCKIDWKELKHVKIIPMVFSMISECWKSSYESLRIRAIQSLGQLFIAYPNLFLESKGMVEQMFTQHRHHVLNVFEDFLNEEEMKLEKAKVGNQLDSGVTNAVVPQFLNQILDSFNVRDQAIRLDALRVIELSLRQGLIIPNKVIPCLVALDAIPSFHTLNVYVESRHHNLLVTRIAEGLSLGFSYGVTSNFSSLSEVIKHFTLTDKLTVCDSILKEMTTKSDVALVWFLCEVVSSFSLSLVEVLHILYKLNNWIDLESSSVTDKATGYIQSYCCIISFVMYLSNAYSVSKQKLEEYDPTAPSKTKSIACTKNHGITWLFSIDDDAVSQCKSLLQEHMLHSSDNMKRKRSDSIGKRKK